MEHNLLMSRRGAELSEHILFAAKTVFLEMGFERASMDVIALRAQTSKRTLYAHFESKERLYLAIIELVRQIYLSKIKKPGEYSVEPSEALVQFCGRYLEGLIFVWTIRMCRMIASEAERFPEGAARYFEVIFKAPEDILGAYLAETFNMSELESLESARALIGRAIYPRFPRALFGIDPAREHLDDEFISPEFDLDPIRAAVSELVSHLGGRAKG